MHPVMGGVAHTIYQLNEWLNGMPPLGCLGEAA
jgi:hypothetical protein